MNRLTTRLHFLLCGALLVMLGACGKDSGLGGASNSVWDTYDFRHPVPYGASVPDSRATTYDQYQADYESYYVPPRGYVPPAPPQPDFESYYVLPRGYVQPSPPRKQNKAYTPCIPGDPGCLMGN